MHFLTVVKKGFTGLFILVAAMLIPAVSFCQIAPGPGDPADVPFDSNLNLVFLAIGVVFAAVIIAKRLRKNAVA
jgi:hypothetical protein